MRCIAVINQKGGVGKTTSTVNIGAALASRGNKVLLLDVDPQANLTLHLDRRPEGDEPTMTDLLIDGKPLAEMMIDTSAEGLFMVPADTSLSGVETMLANRIGRETILREAIEAFDEDENAPSFDYILLDCPPSLGVLSANALVCADDIIIPMQAEYFSMQGMTKLMEVMQLVKQRLNPELSICLILPCMVDRRTNLTNEVLSELRQHFGDVLAETCIRSNVKLAEAPSFGRTIFEHAPESNGARDYAVVADELLRRFAGTFEPAPLEEDEDEYEVDEEEEEEEEEGGDENEDSEVVEEEEFTLDHEDVRENDGDPPVHNGAPFVEAAPPAAIPSEMANGDGSATGDPTSSRDAAPASVEETPESSTETTCVALAEITCAPWLNREEPATDPAQATGNVETQSGSSTTVKPESPTSSEEPGSPAAELQEGA